MKFNYEIKEFKTGILLKVYKVNRFNLNRLQYHIGALTMQELKEKLYKNILEREGVVFANTNKYKHNYTLFNNYLREVYNLL